MNIKCTVTGQKLKIETPMRHFPEGSEEFVRFLFTFSDDWSGLMTFAQFRQNRNVANLYLSDYTDPEDGETYKSVYLPRTGVEGIEFEPGLLSMTLYGTGNEIVIGTTNYVVLCLDPTGFVGGETSDLNETLYQQLVNRFIEYEWRYEIVKQYMEKFGNYEGAWEALVRELETADPLAIVPATESTLGGIKLDATDFMMGTGADEGKLKLKDTIARTTRVDALETEVNKRAALTYGSATRIDDEANLDYLLAAGTYYYPYQDSTEHHVNNRPSFYPFLMNVIRTTGGGRVFQIAYAMYISNTTVNNKRSGVYVRRKNDPSTPTEPTKPTEPGPDATPEEIAEYEAEMASYEAALEQTHGLWSKWERLTTSDEIENRVSNNYDYATHLLNVDLDDIIDPGTYCAMTAEDADGIFHAPVKRAFMMHVLRPFGGAGRAYQIAEVWRSIEEGTNEQSGIFVRRKIDSSTSIPVDPGPDATEEEIAAYEVARENWHALWSSWQMLATNEINNRAMIVRRLLTNVDDMDDILDTGIYHFSGTKMPAHSPVHTGGELIVYNPGRSGGYFVSQQVYVGDGVYFRFQSSYEQDETTGSHWYPWYKIGGANGAAGHKIRVMQYNLGAFRMGYKLGRSMYWPSTLDNNTLPAALKKYKKFFAKYQPDILGVQEYSRYMGVDDNTLEDASTPICGAWSNLFGELFAYMSSDNYSSAAASPYLFSNTKLDYANGRDNYMMTMYASFQELAEGDSIDNYRTRSAVPDVEPVSGISNRTVRVRTGFNRGTAIMQGGHLNFQICETFVGGHRVAIATSAGPNDAGVGDLAYAYLTNLVSAPNAPATPATGDYWQRLETIFRYADGAWVETSGISVADTAPAAPKENDVWYRPGNGFYEWDGSAWNSIADAYTSAIAPANPNEGTWWYLVGGMFRWNGSSWEESNGVVISDTQPVNPYLYDYWYTNSVMYQWNGSDWVVPADADAIYARVDRDAKLNVFTNLAVVLKDYDIAIIITDSNCTHNTRTSFDTTNHEALVELMEQYGYKSAVNINGYWGAKATYVVHGEENVFLAHKEDYLTTVDAADREALGVNASFRPIDNIFVKGNVKIRNVEVLADDWEDLNSDHIPVIADLVIY